MMTHDTVSGARRRGGVRAVDADRVLRLALAASGWTFLAALISAPIVHGGNVPLAWGLNAALFGGLLAVLAVSGSARRHRRGMGASGLGWLLPAGAVVLVWSLVQAASWTPSVLAHEAWSAVRAISGADVAGTISAEPRLTQLATLRLGGVFAAFLCAFMLASDRVWARRILLAVAVAGLSQAVYAMFATTMPGDGTGTARAIVTGTFVNRNHFAIYLGIGIVAAWALLLRQGRRVFRDHGLGGSRELAARAVDIASLGGVAFLFLAPMATALVLTTSRAGIALATLAVTGMTAIVMRWAGRSAMPTVVALLLLLLAGGAGLLHAHAALLEHRIDAGSVAADIEPRLDAARITMTAIADRPLLGHGHGTFPRIFASFRDGSLPLAGRWDEAHNVILETLLELGVPAGGLLVVLVVMVGVRCLKGVITRRRDQELPAAAVAVLTIVGLHALIDFSLQLQGIAITVAAVCGMGLAQSRPTRGKPFATTAFGRAAP